MSASQVNFEATGLKKKERYSFWVTASTTVGEGDVSKTVTISAGSHVPAKIASFDNTFSVTYREDVKLPCQSVGAPFPEIKWKIKGVPYAASERIRLLPEGSLLVREVSRDDAGEYTCTVENMYGQDTVTHQLQVQGKHVLCHLTFRWIVKNYKLIGLFLNDSSAVSTSPFAHNYYDYFHYHQAEATQGGRNAHSRLYGSLQARIWRMGNGQHWQLYSGLYY